MPDEQSNSKSKVKVKAPRRIKCGYTRVSQECEKVGIDPKSFVSCHGIRRYQRDTSGLIDSLVVCSKIRGSSGVVNSTQHFELK